MEPARVAQNIFLTTAGLFILSGDLGGIVLAVLFYKLAGLFLGESTDHK